MKIWSDNILGGKTAIFFGVYDETQFLQMNIEQKQNNFQIQLPWYCV